MGFGTEHLLVLHYRQTIIVLQLNLKMGDETKTHFSLKDKNNLWACHLVKSQLTFDKNIRATSILSINSLLPYILKKKSQIPITGIGF
jgi:hypothetical protein